MVKMFLFKRILLVVFLICISGLTFAQSESDLEELKKAYIDVQEGQYDKAYPYFNKMLISYPKDPTYNYYVGRCLLYVDKDINKAIKHLRFASNRNVPTDVYFYLGLAYLRNYEFEEAEANFKWFEKKANKKQAKDLEVSNYKSMAQNGLYLIRFFKEPLVYSSRNVPIQTFYKNYDVTTFEGNLVDRFEYFSQSNDSSSYPNVLFVPDYMENKEVLYFSAKNKKHGDFDIYRITRLTDTSWSKAENLGDIINTPFDESFPFIHSDGSTLYFASKGHYSMGGYDLYKSTWNWENQEWTEPENLDFPVNSPFDDILFVPSQNKKMAFFASNREQLSSEVSVYQLKIDSKEPYVEYETNDQIREIAKLEANAVIEEPKKSKEKEEKKIEPSRLIVKVTDDENFLKKSEYDSLLDLAINLQLKADSVKWILNDKREIFDNIKDGQERAQVGNQIVELEREVYNLQKKADKCYESVREIEQINIASNSISYENQVKYQEINKEEVQVHKTELKTVIVEPKNNSLQKSTLKSIEPDVINVNKSDFGLRVTYPLIYNAKNPIKINEKLPKGVVYLIQLGAFSSVKKPEIFKGIEPITCIKKENSNIHKYYAGRFLNLSKAEKDISIVKSKGFKDAYIVAFNNGKIIPINSAVKLESNNTMHEQLKEEELKNFVKTDAKELSIIYVIKASLNQGDIELINNLKADLVEQEIYFDESKSSDNLIIKSFASYENANAIKTKIEKVLQVEVEIHAYFAENQIPLNQARKITQ